MNRPLYGPSGHPINNGGPQPVVAHVLTLNKPNPTRQDVEALAGYWLRNMGVPAIVLTGGAELLGSVLADGTLVPVHLDPEMTLKVQSLLDERNMARPGSMPTTEGMATHGQPEPEADTLLGFPVVENPDLDGIEPPTVGDWGPKGDTDGTN